MRPLDYVAVTFAAALVIVIAIAVYSGGGDRATVRVTAPSGEYLFLLTAEETIVVRGPIGETVVRIGDGGARVLSSPGPKQICVKAGHVSRPGAWLACLPNRVFVSIESRQLEDVDARSY